MKSMFSKCSLVVSIVFVLVTFLIPGNVQAEENNILYALTLGYDGTTLSRQHIELIEGNVEPQTFNSEDTFQMNVTAYDNTRLFSTEFTVNADRIFSAPREGDNTSYNTAEVKTVKTVTAPYFPNARFIEIFKDNSLRLVVDVSKFSTDIPADQDVLPLGLTSPPAFQLPPEFASISPSYKKSMSGAAKFGIGLIVVAAIGGAVFVFYKKGILRKP